MFKYETHLHTYEASLCASSKGCLYPQYYKDLGYDGIFVTDHFFNGNSRIPVYDNWEKRVNEFCKGYENAKAAGDAIGFPVFFGWEANFDGDEFLIYGLDKRWLLDHPDILSYSRKQQYDIVHADGGLVVQAHPFRERGYLNSIRLNPESCDAMEAYNAFNQTRHNHNAELYCREKDIFMTAGSDIHKIGTLPRDGHYGMGFDNPIESATDYVKAILNREGTMLVSPGERILPEQIHTGLPVYVNTTEAATGLCNCTRL